MHFTNKKKLLWASILITLVSIFLVSFQSNNFGAPFQFVRYIGDKELPTAFSLFNSSNITQIDFNILYFSINIALIYFILFSFNNIIVLLKSNNPS